MGDVTKMSTEGTAWPSCLQSSSSLPERIKNARVLCIGAGGIGCELLKTLVCTGFQNIELIDLDTIETSNLNRQFLFRRHHVGMSKAKVAAEVVQGIKPEARIVAHHANIKESQFDLDFFKKFDMVLNGLDNLEARRHVNRLCMAAQRPLIESGTAGYLGQFWTWWETVLDMVSVHIKGVTECFECQPKPVPKTFPICTLRNTPDRPIHCIVWGKELLFARLFGKPEDITDLDEASKEAAKGDSPSVEDSGQPGGSGQRGPPEPGEAGQSVPQEDASAFLRADGEDVLAYACRIFRKVYHDDIVRLVGMEDLWKKRAPPKPLLLDQLLPDLQSDVGAALASAPRGASACKILGLTNPNLKWDARDNARVFLASVALYLTQRTAEVGSLVFDKDDDLAVEFVTAASNLRSFSYSIPEQSLFDAKGMAGNIIHAIATTNAIISGFIVIEALKVLSGSLSASCCTFLYEHVSSKRLIGPCLPEPPRPGCMACGQAQLDLALNTTTFTLGELITQVVKKRLAVCVPMLQCGSFFYEEGEGLEEDEVELYQGLLKRTLTGLPGGGLRNGSILAVKDELQHFNLELIIMHQEDFDPEEIPEGFVLKGVVPAAQLEAEAGPSSSHQEAEDLDDLVMLDEAPPSSEQVKRKREEEEGEGAGEGKKPRPAAEA